MIRLPPRPREPAPAAEAPSEKRPAKRRRASKGQNSRLREAVELARDRIALPRLGDWAKSGPEAFVGLYALMHEHVYGVFPDELAGDWMPAVSTARRCLDQSFLGNGEQMNAFMRWVWRRQNARRRSSEPGDFRIGWRYQFSPKLVTDWRVATRQ